MIKFIREHMGLNCLQLAKILHNKDYERTPLDSRTLDRLNILYEAAKYYSYGNLGPIGSLLSKPLGCVLLSAEGREAPVWAVRVSLLTILCEDEMNIKDIRLFLSDIIDFKLEKKRKDDAYQAKLIEHGFEPVSKEDRRRRLDRITRWGIL